MIIKITINSYYLLTLYSLEISNYLIKLNYISIALMAFAFLKLSSNQIRNEVPRLMKTVIHLYSLCFVFLIIILPVNGLLHFVNITESFYFIFAIFFIKKLYTLYKKGQKVLRVTLIAYVIFLWFIILDYLLQNSIIAVWLTEFISILILFIIICGITDIAKRYIKNYNEKEHMKILLENMYISTQDDQLKFLKAQIKPHFVHNALNSIISISRTDSERSRELLIEFSQYLRNSLDFENLENLIPIDREIQFIKSYLIIEKERFGEKINIEYDLDNINIKIPPLILQPLVENAIHHGIRKKANGGIINIYVKKYKNEIYIGVKDDGVGIPESKIDNLLKGIENNQGIGLFNINQRLMRIYQTSLKIENNTTGGVNIYFKVPIDKRGFISENRYNR